MEMLGEKGCSTKAGEGRAVGSVQRGRVREREREREISGGWVFVTKPHPSQALRHWLSDLRAPGSRLRVDGAGHYGTWRSREGSGHYGTWLSHGGGGSAGHYGAGSRQHWRSAQSSMTLARAQGTGAGSRHSGSSMALSSGHYGAGSRQHWRSAQSSMTLARAQGTGTGSRQHWLYGARLLARLRPPVVALNLSSGSSLSLLSRRL
jgi:hypothetical protein